MSTRRFLLAVLGAMLWTAGACYVANRMLHYDWEFSCSTDSECEAEWDVKAAAERSID